ncbi:transporter, major facilitator family protein [Toxoplasma gondii p89]|uniref:Transporter, major facilitator family protein n=1 Tax=Toxoplasma gondii p89 TaxID=943119 RepID=A0A086JS01_TOXGO|nr:transporter, major facilitator family protein [Toxoplasma gondii p89]
MERAPCRSASTSHLDASTQHPSATSVPSETGCALSHSPSSTPQEPQLPAPARGVHQTKKDDESDTAVSPVPSPQISHALPTVRRLSAVSHVPGGLKTSETALSVSCSPHRVSQCSEGPPSTGDSGARSISSTFDACFPRLCVSRGCSQDGGHWGGQGRSCCESLQSADGAQSPVKPLGGGARAPAPVSCCASTVTGEEGQRFSEPGDGRFPSSPPNSRRASALDPVSRRPGDSADSAANQVGGDRDAAGVPPYMHIDPFPQVDRESFGDDSPGAEVVFGASSHPNTPFSLMKEVLVAIYMLYAFLTGCVYFGWPSLAYMLYKSGAYSWMCEVDESGNYVNDLRGTSEPDGEQKYYICDSQDVAVSPLFTVSYVTQTLMSVVAGTLLDHVSPKKTAMLGQTLTAIGWLLLACSSQRFPAYVASMVFIGLGTDTGYLPTLLIATLFPGKRATVITLLGTANTSSFAVPLILATVWNNLLPTWTFSQICILYLCVGPVFCFILAALFIPSRAFGKPAPGAETPAATWGGPPPRDAEKRLRRGSKGSRETLESHWTDQTRGSNAGKGKRQSVGCSSETDAQAGHGGWFRNCSKRKGTPAENPEPRTLFQRVLHPLTLRKNRIAVEPAEGAGARPGGEDTGASKGDQASSPDSPRSARTRVKREDGDGCCDGCVHESGDTDMERGPRCSFLAYDRGSDSDHSSGPAKDEHETETEAKLAGDEALSESDEKLVEDGRRPSLIRCCHQGKQELDAERNAPVAVVVHTGVEGDAVAAEPSFMSQLCSSHFVCIALYWSCQAVATSFFQTAASRLFTTRVVDFMDFVLSFSFIPCVLLGKTIDVFGPFPVLILINTAGVLVYFLSIIGHSLFPTGANSIHYLAVICFCVYVAIDSEQVFCYVENTFSSRHFGKLSGLALTVGGVISLGSIPLYENVTIRMLKGDPLPVAWCIAVILSIVYVMLGCMWNERRRNPRAFHSLDDKPASRSDRETEKPTQASSVRWLDRLGKKLKLKKKAEVVQPAEEKEQGKDGSGME